MRERKVRHTAVRAAALAACVAGAACTRTTPPEVGDARTPPPAAAATPVVIAEQTPAPSPTPPPPPPPPAEAEAALERVYRHAVVVDRGLRAQPVVGDFNADGSQDLAVAVRPSPDRLAEINGEFANWIVVDPKTVWPPAPKRGGPPPAPAAGRTQVARGDALLAVIHGHGPEGWRSPEATQSYLLKNAVGEEMRGLPFRNVPGLLKVKERGANPRADVISARLAGARGFLYWARGKYVWQED